MPDTAFALSPLQSAMEAARARRAARLTAAQPAAEAPTLAPVEPQAAPGGAEASTIPSDFTPFEAAAVKHSVPINILQGVAEASGAGPDRADDIALRLAGPLSQGRSVPDAIASLFPDGKLPAGFIDTVRDRAKAIGKTYEQPAAAPESAPAPAEDNRSLVEKVIDPFGTTKELGKGLVRGVAGSISAGATSLGYDETAKSAADVAADPRLAPDVGSYRDVSGPQSAAKYVAGMAAESAPEMATVLTAAAGGGVVAGPAGAIGAGTATSAFFNTGRNVQRQAAEMPGQAPSYPRAIAAGLVQGGLDTLVPGHIVGAFGTRLLGALAEKGLLRAGTEVGADVLVEGVAEGTQQIIEQAQANPDLLRIMVNPNPDEAERSDQLLAEVADSVIGGAVIGGVFAGGAAALGGPGKHEAPGGAAAEEIPPEAAAPPAGPLEAALAQGPAPVASGFETGAKLDITNTDPETGEVVNIPGTFVREDHTGVRIMDAEGTEHLIPRDEIESGATTLGPAVAPQEAPVDDTQPSEPVADDTQAPDATAPGELAAAAQAAIEPPAVPAREDRPAEPETPEEIETRLAYLREQRRSGGSLKRINREIADLTEKLAALQPEVDAPAADGYAPTSAGSAGVPAEAATPGPSDAPEPATITPSEIRTKAGAPFRSIGQAKQAIRARGFLPENFTIRPTDGGFVVVPHDAQVIDAQPVPSGTTDPAQTASAMSVEAGASAPAPEAAEGPGEPSAALMLPKPNSPRARREAKNGTGEAAFTEAASAPSGGEDAPVVSPEPAEGAVRAPEATAAAVQDAAATPKAEEIAAAAAEAHPNPSEAQAEAENHKVGRVKLHGLDISIETAKGNTRPGRDAPVAAHYGRILGTRGADGDHVDVYVGDHPDSARAFVIDQFDPESGAFDEKKTVLGANTADEATAIYDAGFSDGSGLERRRGAAPTEMSVDEFKAWLKDGDQTKPAQNTEGANEQAASPAEPPQPAEPEAAGQKAGGQEEPPAAQFGPVFTEYRDDPEGAIARLMREKDGDARAAFIHPEVGPIDFVYGDEKKGLRHIEAKRGRAFVDRLPEILRNGAVVRRPEFKDRVYIVESADDPARVAAIRLDYDGREKVWLVTAFSDEKGGFVARREGTASFPPRTASPHIPDATGPDENNPSGAQDQAYGASNKLVSADRAVDLRERLKAKLRDQLNSGIDPEILAIGAELAVFHIEAGARRFLDLAKAIADDLGTTPTKLKPYLRSWYNGARDMLEDHGHSIEGMDDPQAVREALTQITEPVVQSEPESGGPSDDDDRGNAADDAEPLAEDLPPDGGEAVAEEADGREPGLRPVDADGDGHPEAGDGPVGAGSLGGGPDAVLPDREGAEPRPVGQGPIHRTEDKPAPLSGQSPGNFVITPDVGVGTGTNGEKIRANLAAIRILKALRAEHRFPTAEEQAAMARYVGWGGLKPVFDVKKTGASDMYGRAQAELREILTPDEYRAASASITDAHYTAPGVVEAMWRAARHFGFKGGRVLEPTVGVGNFIGLQPADMAASSEWHAAELDKITGGLAQMLYPEANILPGTGFEDAMFADGVFDLAIGNPPFGDWRVKDKHKVRKHLSGLKIHNYIIAKAGMHLRPGGIMQMVVTHRFLDTANPEARDVLAKDFRFLGAIRLPNDAFRANAGTEVTTDIIFLQKLGPSEKRDRAAAWLDVDGEIEGGIRVNRYFQENPQHILGRSAMDGSMYGGRRDEQGNGEYTVHSDGRDLGQVIDQILATDWKGLRNTLTDGPMTPPTAVMLSQSDLPVGGMMLDADGTIIRRAMDDAVGNSILEPITQDSFWKDLAAEWDRLAKAAAALKNGDIGSPMDLIDAARPVVLTAGGEKKSSPTQAEQAAYDLIDFAEKHGRYGNWQFDDHLAKIQKAAANRRLGVKGFATLRGLLDLRNRTLELIAAEQSDATEIEDLRSGLNAAYDAYVQAHGYIGENIGVLDGDLGVEVGLEASYEPAIGAEAAKREGVHPRPAQATKSAILSKRINFPHKVITRADSVEDGLGVSLSERGKVDLPYIAGLVGKSVMEVTSELSRGAEPRIFLDPIADRYVDAEEYLSGNVKKKLAEAREAGLAKNAEALEKVLPEPLAQSRITPSLRGAWIPADVMQDFLTDLGVQGPVVRITPEIGRIVADGGTGTPNALGAEFKDDNATIVSIFNAAAQGKPITVRVKDGDKMVVDKDATRILGAKTERMQKVFAEWAYSEEGRAKKIVDAFNEKMNTHRPRTYDGVKYLRIPGASTEISLRRTQKNAAWRMVLSRNVLLDHVVGAGKAQSLDSRLLTPTGWVRMGDIKVGDRVIAQTGEPTIVTGVFPQGEKEIFRVVMSDGSSTECCDEHLWLTQTYRERGYAQRGARLGKDWGCGVPKARALSEIRATLAAPHLGAKNHSIPIVGSVQFDPQTVPLDPWLIGFLIGDGCFVGKSVTFSTADVEILDRVRTALPDGCTVEHSDRCNFRINGGRPHLIRDALRAFGLIGKKSAEKHVPVEYLFNDARVRLEVLRGLMDSDGTVNASGTHVSFTTASPDLADCVEFLARSLGGITRRTMKATSGLPAHKVTLTMPAAVNPFWLSRKAERVRPKGSYAPARYITAVEPVGRKPAQCIRIAHPSHLYVTDDFIVTHNTYTIIAGVMEKRRLGISRKPLIAVPNHLVVQWARDFYNLYPAAKILAATPADFSAKNRKRLLARIATGDFDAIVIGHTSLGFIETAPEDLTKVIDEKVEELENALRSMRANGESKRTQGQIEQKIKSYTNRLEEIAERPTDQIGVNLREMGVDDLTVDEMHEFKNLEYATSGERVVGMNDPNGSKKAFDLYAKVRGIQRRGGSVTGATGTPVSNSLVELYTVMSYFAHDDLAAQGVAHFDAWSGAYAVTETKLEYTATQKLKPRRVLASLTNLASLHQLYSAFADTITMATIKAMYAEDVAARNKALGTHERTEFPVPKVRDGGRVLRNGPITPQQSEFMDYLVARMNAIQAAGGKPEYMKIDNALWVLTDARKMSLDIRTVDPTAMRDENGKVMRAARSIKEIYDRWAEDRGTQLVFCDLSTPSKGAAKAAGKILTDAARVIWGDREGRARLKAMEAASFEDRWRWLNAQRDAAMENPNVSEEQRDRIDEHFARIEDADAAMSVADVGFSVYDDMRAVLSEMGIPSTEIAFIHDFETPAQKQKLFSRVNAGAIRVLMGSSQKMGAGTNAQERLVALHHMDAPWRPSDVEQREGRIIRQGNKLYQRDPDGFDVEINAYSTEGTSDTVMWQVLQRKAAGIEQFREGGIDAMDEDGGDSDQYAEFMASSTGNPVFRYNLEAERAATDAESQYGGRQIAKANATRFVEQYPRRKRALSDRVEAVAAATPGDLSYGGESGSIDDLTSAMSAARRAYEKAFAKYEEDMAAWGPIAEEATAKLAAEDAAGLPKKERTKVPPAPEKPTRPSMMSPSVLEKSGYARAVKAALEAISGKDFGEQVEIKMGAVDLLLEKQKRYNGDPVYGLDVVIAGEAYSLGRSDARVPVNSPNLLAAFMPSNITERIERVGNSAGLDLKQMESRLPKEREMAGIEVSRDEVDAARELSRWYKAQVALAEVAADVKRGERPNRYIEGDTKRPLKGFSGEKEAPQDFEYAGDRYQGTGISAESGFGRRLYEATRQSDGAKAVVLKEAKQDGEIKDVMIEPKAAAERGEVKLARRGGPDSLASFEATQDILSRAADVISSLREQLGKLVPGIDLGVADKLFVFDRAGNEIAADGMLSTDGFIVMALDGQRDKGRTLGHEAIHALRAPAIWGTPFGLFREREWKVLERTATQRDGLMDAVRRDYPDLSPSEQLEEAVAELFGIWRTRGEAYGVARQAFERIASFLEALGNALRGHGFTTAASVMRRIESGDVGARGRGKIGKPAAARAARTGGALAEVESDTVAASDWPAVERGLIGNAITKAMSGTHNFNLLALVPGRALFAELAKAMPTAQEYLRLKGEMDALRSEWHGKTDTIAQRWRKILSANGTANKAFMDLMHEATLAGADPSRPFVYDMKGKDEEKRRRAHAALKTKFDALPAEFKPLWGEIRDAYKALGDEFEATLLANVNKAMDVGLARAERAHAEALQQAKDDGLSGAALASVKAAADKKLATAKLWSGWNKKARMADLRMKFETNKVSEPYFPLARFGDFFVTVRDKEDGHVVAFSKFESPAKQQAFAAEMRADGYSVEVGTIGKTKTRDMVDHGFVTDVENILQNAGVSDAVLDSVWQRWLETMPDFSIRKARIHRKGTPGFSPDAFRAFGHHMFHGAHQLARLRYSMDLQEALDLTKEAARHQPDPVRAGLVWQEMERRHEFAMNPKGAWWAQAISSAAFFFHLAFSPAAALVNLSQTTVIGIPVLAGFHGETARGTAIASRELGRALVDFTNGKGHAVESDRLTADEKAALTEAYRRGTIDASQAHDLAGVAESGVEYSDLRTKWMGRMSWFFHHAERLNREVTFLAAYRMARAKGLEEHAAIDKASDLTWRIHFDYQNTSKPRAMQGNSAKALLTFKNYSANMIWRLVRDTHQALHGASPEERREALHQLGGITASMALHAGIRGTWLYGLAMMLVGLFFGGGSDEAEEELQRGAVNLLGRQGAALVLNGIPGALTGTDLTERIGMPDLWFRSPDRTLEGKDIYLYWVEQMLGAGFGIIANQFVGADLIRQGNVERGIETMMPKVVKDAMRAYRYATDGVQTMKGDPILEDADPSVALKQILGFTPAEIAERYEANSRMKNREQRIEEERSDIVKEFVAALRDGGKPTAEMIARRDRFNAENPDYPIVGSTIRRSLSGKIQASRRQEFGASLNPRLNDRIRREAAPLLTGE